MKAHIECCGRRLAGIILAAGAVMLIAPLAARAQSCTVNATTDTGAGSGTSGDVLYCVTQASAATSPGNFTIGFDPSLNGQTITLSSTLALTNTTSGVTISIQGPGANLLTISGNTTARSAGVQVFSISSGTTVNISGLTIANGEAPLVLPSGASYGGGIFNAGTLTVSNSTFSANTTGSSGHGGGIYSAIFSTLTVSNSTFSANTTGSSGNGGGIYSDNFSTLTVSNSTFSGNTAGAGGGIEGVASTLTVSNSTFSGNNAPFGGGIENLAGAATIVNSIVAGNSGDDCDNCGTQSSFNLIGGNPQLAPLGSYGGTTQTMVPLLGSPAIGAGQYMSGEPTTDQRGFPRPSTVGAAIDLGAVQLQNLIVTTTTDQIDSSPDCSSGTGNTCSLRDALEIANNQGSADINFAAGGTGIINLSPDIGPLPAITGSLNLMGPGAQLLTISGGGSVGPIFTLNSSDVNLSGLTIANGYNGPGGVFNSGTATINNCAIVNNIGGFGGGILNGGTLTVSNTTFLGNTSSNGGAISNNDLIGYSGFNAALAVVNSTFSGNSAFAGGAIANYSQNPLALTISDSTISGNTASSTHSAGGIDNESEVFILMFNSIVAGNSGGDCSFCGSQSSNLIGGGNPQLAPIGYYGGPFQTMLPLPGSPAICLGNPSTADAMTDQRGFPRFTTYSGYECLDAGAVQTNYQSVQFTNAGSSGYSGSVNAAVNTPAAPIVSVTENNQNIGGVPVTLSFSGNGTATGLGPVTTVAGTGATFPAITVNQADSSDTLSATLNITSHIYPGGPSVSITTGNVSLDITSPATTTTVSATPSSPTYGQAVTLLATVTSGSGTPTGSVSFSIDGGTAVPGTTLSSSTCPGSPANASCSSYTTSTLNAGGHSALATYTPTGAFQGSNGNTTLTVSKATATVTLGNLTVTYNGSQQSPTVTTSPSGLSTSLTGAPDTSAGSYPVTATITDPNYTGSASGTFVINKAATTTAITANTPNPSVTNQAVTVSFSVTPQFSGTPTGAVTVNASTGEKCTVTLPSSSCVLSFTTSGARTITASYAGDSNFTGSASAGVTQTVQDFTISASPASQTISAGKTATYTLTLGSISGFSGTVTLGCSGAPPKWTCSVPSSVSLNANATATAKATLSGKDEKGTYALTFTAGSGGVTHTAAASLTVK